MNIAKRIKNGYLQCPCCGYYTLNADYPMYDICPVCFWENDSLQLDDPDYEGGANSVSLNQARKNYQTFGACEKGFIPYVREPHEKEL